MWTYIPAKKRDLVGTVRVEAWIAKRSGCIQDRTWFKLTIRIGNYAA